MAFLTWNSMFLNSQIQLIIKTSFVNSLKFAIKLFVWPENRSNEMNISLYIKHI